MKNWIEIRLKNKFKDIYWDNYALLYGKVMNNKFLIFDNKLYYFFVNSKDMSKYFTVLKDKINNPLVSKESQTIEENFYYLYNKDLEENKKLGKIYD